MSLYDKAIVAIGNFMGGPDSEEPAEPIDWAGALFIFGSFILLALAVWA